MTILPTPQTGQQLGIIAMPTPNAISEGWKDRLLMGGGNDPHPLANVHNAIIALQYAPDWQGVLHQDESALEIVARSAPPWDDARSLPFTWTDTDDVAAAAWMQRQGIAVGKDIVSQAVQRVARDRCFHPIRDYLDSLVWDEEIRLEEFANVYLGAEPSEYVEAVGLRFFLGAVARIYEPGAKVDTCIILEGPQGSLKSSALRALGEPWFTDELADLGSKDAAMQMRGKWIIELPELDAMQKTEVARIKSFMSRSVDRYRPPYGRRVITVPRECVFAGTVNHSVYLKDETGGRRFWPIKTGRIDLATLKHDRDQLWAEARVRYQVGTAWWLDSAELNRLAAHEQSARYEPDPWDQRITAFVESKTTVSVEEVLAKCIKKPTDHLTQSDQNRVARSLRSLGWERFRHRDGQSLSWRYRRKS